MSFTAAATLVIRAAQSPSARWRKMRLVGYHGVSSRAIIQRRWLQDGEKATLQELADEYGVSAERIRQIEANAMKKMRALFVA